MNSVPAKLAKVKRLVLATPKINGKLNPAVLYAAKKVGITEIWNFGGAQAIASLAYIQKVNKIVGPGNKFVAEAKRQLSGRVIGTEAMFAGPSEICVLADRYSDVEQVATSLISQAEHDEDSQCIMVTKDIKLANKVKKRILELLKKLLNDEIKTRQKTNIVQSKKFSEMIENAVRNYQNNLITSAQVIEKLIKLAKEIKEADRKGEDLGLDFREFAFYSALEVNDSAVAVLGDEILRHIARELVDTIRKNSSIDWTVRENVQAKMRIAVKKILE